MWTASGSETLLTAIDVIYISKSRASIIICWNTHWRYHDNSELQRKIWVCIWQPHTPGDKLPTPSEKWSGFYCSNCIHIWVCHVTSYWCYTWLNKNSKGQAAWRQYIVKDHITTWGNGGWWDGKWVWSSTVQLSLSHMSPIYCCVSEFLSIFLCEKHRKARSDRGKHGKERSKPIGCVVNDWQVCV